jgi:hypothetical protein
MYGGMKGPGIGGGLASTGFAFGWWAVIVAILLLAGLALVLVALRNRRMRTK